MSAESCLAAASTIRRHNRARAFKSPRASAVIWVLVAPLLCLLAACGSSEVLKKKIVGTDSIGRSWEGTANFNAVSNTVTVQANVVGGPAADHITVTQFDASGNVNSQVTSTTGSVTAGMIGSTALVTVLVTEGGHGIFASTTF